MSIIKSFLSSTYKRNHNDVVEDCKTYPSLYNPMLALVGENELMVVKKRPKQPKNEKNRYKNSVE